MAEALGVVASVIGIVAAAGKVVELLNGSAPGLVSLRPNAKALLTEARDTEIILQTLQGLLLAPSLALSQRKDLISIEHLVTLLTSGVQFFSELESLLKRLGEPMNEFKSRLQWRGKEEELGVLYQRLQTFKMNISILLNIFQCASQFEASRNQAELEVVVRQMKDSNQELAKRVASLEGLRSQFSDAKSIGTFETSMTSSHYASHDHGDSKPSKRASIRMRPFAFEEILNTSRPYLQIKRQSVDYSFHSSVPRSHAWSYLSLSDVSCLSVVALPISLNEIANSEHYLTSSDQLESKNASQSIGQSASASLHGGQPAREHKCRPRCSKVSHICIACMTTFCSCCCDMKVLERHKDHDITSTETWHRIMRSMDVPSKSESAPTMWLFSHQGDEKVEIYTFDRASSLMAGNKMDAHISVPSRLVTFIGDAGVGKSTIVRLLMEQQSMKVGGRYSCVLHDNVMPGGPAQKVPGIHLYIDPATISSASQIFYGICQDDSLGEGQSLTSPPQDMTTGKLPLASYDEVEPYKFLQEAAKRAMGRLERQIQFEHTASPALQLHQTLCYLVSSAIVHISTDQTSILGLVLHAHKTEAFFGDGTARPALIIVRNKLHQNQYRRLLKPDDATQVWLDCLDDIAGDLTEPGIQGIVEYWNQRGQPVPNVTALLQRYYSSVRVVCIPLLEKRYTEFDEQIMTLSDEIDIAARTSAMGPMNLRDRLMGGVDKRLDRAIDFVMSQIQSKATLE